MALKPHTSRYSPQLSSNLNQKTKHFLNGNYLLSEPLISNASHNSIKIKDLSLSLNGILVYIESADLQFDSFALSAPYSIFIRCDHNYNTPYWTIHSFDSSTNISEYGSAYNLTLSGNAIEGQASIAYDKTSTDAEAGIVYSGASSLTDFIGIGAKVFIPAGDATNVESISIILDESGTMSDYSKYDRTSGIEDGWNTILGNFDSPDSTAGTPVYDYFVDAVILIKTTTGTTIISSLAVDRLFGICEDSNCKTYDDEIDFYISDNTCNDFQLATYDGTSWSLPDDISMNVSSLAITNHINDATVHIPGGTVDVINESRLLSSDTMITITDSTGATTDYSASNESTLKSIPRTISDPQLGTVTLYDTIYLKADHLRKNVFTDHPIGVSGFISDSSSTATLGYGHYYGDTTPTKVITNVFLSVPGEVDEITVDAPLLKDETSNVTFDIYINDVQISTGNSLATTYDLSADYTTHGLLGTDMRLEFNIPAVSGGDFWTARNTNPLATKSNRLISINDRCILSTINAYLYSHLYEADSWRSLSPPTAIHGHSEPHPASRDGGLRIIPTLAAEGEIYNLATDTWSKISNGSAADGRCVDIGGNEFYNVAATIATKFIDAAGVTGSEAGPGDGWRYGAAFRGHDNKMHIHGGESTATPPYVGTLKSYNFTSAVWSAGASSSSSQALQAYTQLNTKRLHSICGMLDSTTYTGLNNEYNEVAQTWAARTVKTATLKSPAAGLSQRDTIIVANGEKATTNNTNEVFEYTPDLFVKFFGFAAKLKYATLYGEANHVGYWADSTSSFFTASSQAEKDITGYWVKDDGSLFGAAGTWWGYYWMWSGASHPDYASATFDEKWQSGFWSDSNGKIGTDDGPLWE